MELPLPDGLEQIPLSVHYGSGAQINNTGNGTQYYNNCMGNQNNGSGQLFVGINHIGREDPLSLLPFATAAPFNSYDRQDEPKCLPNTRVDLLEKISQWADGEQVQRLFWLSGMAGTGKSTIAHTVARDYHEKGQLAASFFFSKGAGDTGNASKFVTTIALQMSVHIPSIQQHIRNAVTKHISIENQSLADQWRKLVLGPFSMLADSDAYPSYVIVIDALDECENEQHARTIIQLLAEARSLNRVRLHILTTSRSEHHIRNEFFRIPDLEHCGFVLHDIEKDVVDNDISIFLAHRLVRFRHEQVMETDWPGEVVIKLLVQRASRLFIWAGTACRFIEEGGPFAQRRLNIILQGNKSVAAPEKRLDEIYITVLRDSIFPGYSEDEKNEFCNMLRETLGSIVTLYSRLSAHSLATLLGKSKRVIDQTLGKLHAILDIPKDRSRPLYLHHPSFRDFLLNKDRCVELLFWVDEKQAHQILADNCILLMSKTLKQDICNLKAPGMLVAEVEGSQIEQCLPPEVRYACLYWIQHIQRSGPKLHDFYQIYCFLQEHFLHWLEALGWIGKTSEGFLAISSLDALISVDESPDVYAFIHDAKRFALYNRSLIEQAPLQVYSSLIFSPETSIIRKQFEKFIPHWIQTKPKVQADWDAILQALEGHTDLVNSVAFSHDSELLASASDDETVRIWDTATGSLWQTLEGHNRQVNSVAFSHDSKLLASSSDDVTVRIWDTATGSLRQILKGHALEVKSVAFSHDSKLLASASDDRTVRIWDAATGSQQQQMLQGHTDSWRTDPVNSVAFSHDSKLLASASPQTVRVWDVATGSLRQTLEGHTDEVKSVAFSHDSKLLASSSYDNTVRIWDAATGSQQQMLEGHTDSVNSVAFSHDSKLLASASHDKTVRVWDVATGSRQQTLEGHNRMVSSVAFSHDSKLLASASNDRTVRIWDAATGSLRQILKGHALSVKSVAFSHDSKLLASSSYDRTVRIWDTATGSLRQILKGHALSVKSVAFSHDSKLLASASDDQTVRIWDTATGSLRQVLEGHKNTVNSVAFSHDSKLLTSAFSHDSKLLVSALYKTVRVCDVATGSLRQTLEGHTEEVKSVVFSHDSKLLASGSYDKTVRIWDAATGSLQHTLEGHNRMVSSVAFSHDSKLLASVSYYTVLVWDAVAGSLRQKVIVDNTFSSLSFNITDSILVTNIGDIKLNSTIRSLTSKLSELDRDSDKYQGLGRSDPWVTWNNKKLLWLPPDYRRFQTDISPSRSTVAIGCESGRVVIIGFSLKALLEEEMMILGKGLDYFGSGNKRRKK